MARTERIEGSLEDLSLTEILKKVTLLGREGVLTLSWKEKRVFVSCREGEVVRAWEGEEEALLGTVLVRAGKLTTEQLENGLRIQKNIRQPLTRTMVEMGYVTQAEVKRLTRILSEETLYPLFSWPSGRFTFEPSEVFYDPELIEPIHTDVVIMEGLRQAEAWPHLLEKISSLQIVFEATEEATIQAGETLADLEEKYEATQVILDRTLQHIKREEGEISQDHAQGDWLLPFIDGQRTVHALIQECEINAFSAFSVYCALASLMEAGKIKRKDALQFQTHTEARRQIEEEQVEVEQEGGKPQPVLAAAPIGFQEIPPERQGGPVATGPTPEPIAVVRYDAEETSGGDAPMPRGETVTPPDTVDTVDTVARAPDPQTVTPSPGHVEKRWLPFDVRSLNAGAWAINGMVVAAAVIIITFASSSIRASFEVFHAFEAAFEPLRVWSEQDQIRAALERYYLRHRRFPDSLRDLARHGFLSTAREKAIPLAAWSYTGHETAYQLSAAPAHVAASSTHAPAFCAREEGDTLILGASPTCR